MNIRLDIDDTILFSKVDENGEYYLIDENCELIEKINKLYCSGANIIVDTGRHWNHLEITLKQLKECGLRYTTLVMGKPHCDYIVDDKAVRPDEFMELEI